MTPGEAFEAFILSLLGASPGGQKIGDAQAAVRGYIDEDSTPSWKGLDKKAWCDRIIELLGNPKSFKQGNSPYCLAAACLIVLFKRTPETMADFCNALASRGKGKIKDLEIKMTKEIQGYDVPAYAKTLDVNPVDLILLLAIQNAMSPPGFFSSGIQNQKTPHQPCSQRTSRTFLKVRVFSQSRRLIRILPLSRTRQQTQT
jgi:hypothetical protein